MVGRMNRLATEKPVIIIGSLITVPVVVAIAAGGLIGRLAVVLAVLGLAGVYVIKKHPHAVAYVFAATLGGAPYLHVPATSLPALLALSAGLWLVVLVGREFQIRPGGPEFAVLALGLVALFSLVATGVSGRALIEYTAWGAATSVVVPIRALTEDVRARMMRVFVASAVVGTTVAMIVLAGAPRPFLTALEYFSYDPDANVRTVVGKSLTSRLSGTYLEPNVAGLILLVAVLAAVVYLDGRWRLLAAVIVGAGMMLTLSRAAIGTAAVVGLLVILRSKEHRRSIVGAGIGACAFVLAVPSVRSRLLDSFGPNDIGLADRRSSIREFPSLLDGHWTWGLGWARPEFRNSGMGQLVNFASNGPLLTIYRGGLILGVLVVLVGLLLLIRSWVQAGRSFSAAVLCAGVMAFLLVAFQLDFPIVNQTPATAIMSLLVALSFAPPPDREPVVKEKAAANA